MLPILNPFSGTDHRDRLIYEWAGSGATEANIFSFTRPGMKYIFLPIFHVPMDIKNREAYKRFQRKQHSSWAFCYYTQNKLTPGGSVYG